MPNNGLPNIAPIMHLGVAHRRKKAASVNPAHIESAQKLIKEANALKGSKEKIAQLDDKQLKDLGKLLKAWVHCEEDPAELELEAAEEMTSAFYFGLGAADTNEEIAYEFSGVRSYVGMLRGLIALEEEVRALKKNVKEDRKGVLSSAYDLVSTVVSLLEEVAYCIMPWINIPAHFRDIDVAPDAETVLGRACYWVEHIASILFSIGSALGALKSSYLLFKDFQWSNKIEREKDDVKLFELFQKKACTDVNAKRKKIKKNLTSEQQEQLRQKMREKGLNRITRKFLNYQSQDKKTLSHTEVKEGFKALFRISEEQLKPIQKLCLSEMGLEGAAAEKFQNKLNKLGDKKWDLLTLMGFQKSETERAERKIQKFSQIADVDTAKRISQAAQRGLKERLKSEDAVVKKAAEVEFAKLKGRVVQQNTKQKRIHSALITIATLGLISGILGLVAISPLGQGFAIGLTIVCSTLLFIRGANALYEAWKAEGKPGIYDKKFAVLMGTLMTGSLSASMALALEGHIDLHSLISSAVVGLLGLILAVASYCIASTKEEEWEANHPSLKTFKKELEGTALSDDKKMERFEQLSKKDRRAIYDKYLKGLKDRKIVRSEVGELAKDDLEKADRTEHLFRAAKKTAHLFWREYGRTHSESAKEKALQMQLISDLIKQERDRADKEKSYWSPSAIKGLKKELSALWKSDEKHVAYKQLRKHLLYFKERDADKLEALLS